MTVPESSINSWKTFTRYIDNGLWSAGWRRSDTIADYSCCDRHYARRHFSWSWGNGRGIIARLVKKTSSSASLLTSSATGNNLRAIVSRALPDLD